MKINSVLAFVDGQPESEETLLAAIAIGQAFCAYVEVLHIKRPVVPVPATIAGPLDNAAAHSMDSMRDQTERRARTARALFDKHCCKAGLNVVNADSAPAARPGATAFAWRQETGYGNRDLAYRGRLFDLIVLAHPDVCRDGGCSAQLEAALFDTGRPVFIAPSRVPDFSNACIAIAWDGSREAAHSVGMALPFLEMAARVVVLRVGEAPDDCVQHQISRYLARHDIQSHWQPVTATGHGVAHALLQESREIGADFVVMGAFGNDPVDDRLLGGVTQKILDTRELSMMLAH